ncbi:hypothetical protein VPHD148_0135 [Vibrio phage D148]
MNMLTIVLVMAIMAFVWFIQNHCFFCKRRITFADYMPNGRIRYRKKGTQYPVCRCCGKYMHGDVE